jgi:hypothetical protein
LGFTIGFPLLPMGFISIEFGIPLRNLNKEKIKFGEFREKD